MLQLPPIDRSSVSSFIAGSVAGASGVLVGHPFDSLKVRLQVGQTLQFTTVNWYVIKQLYRGILPPLMTVGTIQAINFTNYEYFKRTIPKFKEYIRSSSFFVSENQVGTLEEDLVFNDTSNTSSRSKKVSLDTIFYAGTLTGAIMSVLTNPISIIKIRMQVANELGIWASIRELYRVNGIRTFYHGYSSSFILEAPGRGLYMWTYETMKEGLLSFQTTSSFQDRNRDSYHLSPHFLDLSTRVSSAVTAGVLSWLAVYPFDVIKARVQYDITRSQFRDCYHCAYMTWKEGGYRIFYRGLGYTLIRAVPVAGTILPMYDFTKDWLEKEVL